MFRTVSYKRIKKKNTYLVKSSTLIPVTTNNIHMLGIISFHHEYYIQVAET